jgi:hypothetical protein
MAFTGVASNLLTTQVCVASGTGTQASALASNAAQIGALSQIVTITTTAGSQTVVLPPSAPGLQIDVMNITPSNNVFVFPFPGDAINAIAVNSSITMASVTSTTFMCVVQGQWWTNPRVAS